ncbi:hypothetical protein C427_0769 [Paraglaciecola psychrophila 170]|uniref:Uncharacterized protein n=1 Tax=Paraglaciecola psychrophila 170 TaxID=1129794 RepID=M4RJW2_9ALTE|nr:hypothetical protein C427_0769 [Paraglaciecola psychrophila 170]
MFYQLDQDLPKWSVEVLKLTATDNHQFLNESLTHLNRAKQLDNCC